MISDPWKNPQVWETVVLRGTKGNFTLPNCEVDVRAGGVKEGEADVQGQDGTTRTFLGYKDAEATIVARATNYNELVRLQKALEAYRSKRNRQGEDAIKLEVSHPKFVLHNIKYVYIFDVKTSDFTLDDGVIFTFEVREWQPEEKRTTKGSSSREAGSGQQQAAGGQNSQQQRQNQQNQRQQQNQGRNAGNEQPSSLVRGIGDGSTVAANALGGKPPTPAQRAQQTPSQRPLNQLSPRVAAGVRP